MAIGVNSAQGIVLVLLTLAMQSVGMAALVVWREPHFAKDIHRFGLVRAAVSRGAVHHFDCLPAHIGDSVVGVLFSGGNVFSILGIRFLFFRQAVIRRSGLWRSDSSPPAWRSSGARWRSLTGVLMCGVSRQALLFANCDSAC